MTAPPPLIPGEGLLGTGNIAQLVKCFPSTLEDLGLIYNTTYIGSNDALLKCWYSGTRSRWIRSSNLSLAI